MMAQAIKAHAVVTSQRGKRVTAVSTLVSRSDQCASIMKNVTMPICSISRVARIASPCGWPPRSEEHTSELQSRGQLVCRLLLEKKRQIAQSPRAGCRDVIVCRKDAAVFDRSDAS